jgi:hypothetical protein
MILGLRAAPRQARSRSIDQLAQAKPLTVEAGAWPGQPSPGSPPQHVNRTPWIHRPAHKSVKDGQAVASLYLGSIEQIGISAG